MDNNIIENYIDGKFDLVVALRKLLFIAYELKLDKLRDWVNSELYGYLDSNKSKLPEYRTTKEYKLVYSGVKNKVIPFYDEKIPQNYLSSDLIKKTKTISIPMSIPNINESIKRGWSYSRSRDDLVKAINTKILSLNSVDNVVCNEVKQIYVLLL